MKHFLLLLCCCLGAAALTAQDLVPAPDGAAVTSGTSDSLSMQQHIRDSVIESLSESAGYADAEPHAAGGPRAHGAQGRSHGRGACGGCCGEDRRSGPQAHFPFRFHQCLRGRLFLRHHGRQRGAAQHHRYGRPLGEPSACRTGRRIRPPHSGQDRCHAG